MVSKGQNKLPSLDMPSPILHTNSQLRVFNNGRKGIISTISFQIS
jgi:hypothetical protein